MYPYKFMYEFGKITQNNGHFAVQGHSKSPMLVLIKSSYTKPSNLPLMDLLSLT